MSGVIEKRGGTKIRFTGIPLPQMPRATREAQHLAITDAVRYWRAKFAPIHFKVEAYSRYGGQEANVYETPRKGSSRFKKGGGARAPLVSPRRRPTSGRSRPVGTTCRGMSTLTNTGRRGPRGRASTSN